MNLEEIAKRARVSIATASRTINRVPTMDPRLARRVWKVVNELGYYPNTQARGLVSGKSKIFGLIVSEITNPFFSEIVQAFESIAIRHQYEILLTSTLHDSKLMKQTHNSPDGRLSGREVLLAMYIHVAHHRGQAEIYLRDKGFN